MMKRRSRIARPMTVVYPLALRHREDTSARRRAGLMVFSV
jgi:hypothetical protein